MRRLSLLFIKHLCFVCLLITIASCGKDAYDYGIPDNTLNGDEGLIELNLSADFRVSVKSNESSININDFTIQIFNSSNVKIRSWNKLSEITDPIKLNIGNYKLLAFYGDSLITGFEQPYYMGKSYFTVLGQKTVNINTTCKLSNVGLKINWGDNIKANYNDYKVSVYRQGFKDSLKYSNDEVRVGYLPAGTLKFRIYLTDKSGEKRTVSSSSLDLVAKPNDFISLNLDTKKEEPKEIHANFIIDSSVDLKEHEIIIPGSLKPQNPPTITSETSNTSMVFSELEYYPQSLITQINAPAYIEKCILKINSAYLNNVVGVSNEIDLANLDEQTNQLLINNGLEWGEMFGSKLSFIRFDKLISNIPYNESFNDNLFDV